MPKIHHILYAIVFSILILSTVIYTIFMSHSTKHTPSSEVLPHIPFNQSMKIDLYPEIVSAPHNNHILSILSRQYEQVNPSIVPARNYTIIPMRIHIMWLGGKMPDEYESFVASWRKIHPTWTIIFWTDSEKNYHRGSPVVQTFNELDAALETGHQDIVVDASNLVYDNKDMYDAAINYGEKSDILKWEIVYRYGGVYVDIDFEALKPLDPLHYRYDFYTGIQPLDTGIAQLGAALFAARPGHPILHACVTRIRNNRTIKQIIVKTGPIHFTRCFLSLIGKTNFVDIALPASYLYPCDYNQKGSSEKIWRKKESFAVHHWAGSWLKKEAFVKGYPHDS